MYGKVDLCISHVFCSCIACAAVTLVIMGEMMHEHNGYAVLLIGGLMTLWNVFTTLQDYREARTADVKGHSLPISVDGRGEAHEDEIAQHLARCSRKEISGERRRSKRRDRARGQDSSLIRKSPSKAKAARAARRKRKNEKSRSGACGLGVSNRPIRI